MSPRRSHSTGRARPGSARRGPSYPVTEQWQKDVKAEIRRRADARLDVATEKELALAVGCAQSTMHDLLNSEDARYSSLVPDVHRVFGWSPPNPPEAMPPVFSPDALEMAAMYDQLPENVRELMKAQAKSFIDLASKVKTTP